MAWYIFFLTHYDSPELICLLELIVQADLLRLARIRSRTKYNYMKYAWIIENIFFDHQICLLDAFNKVAFVKFEWKIWSKQSCSYRFIRSNIFVHAYVTYNYTIVVLLFYGQQQ